MSTTTTPQEAGALPADALILAYNNAVWTLAQYYTRPGFESAQALVYEAKVTEAHVAIREALAAARREERETWLACELVRDGRHAGWSISALNKIASALCPDRFPAPMTPEEAEDHRAWLDAHPLPSPPPGESDG